MIRDLSIQSRDNLTSAKSLIREGYIPGVVFGKEQSSSLVKIPARVVESKKIAIGNIYKVNIDSRESLLKVTEVQTQPVGNKPLHISFQTIQRGEELTASIPVKLINNEGNKFILVMDHINLIGNAQGLPDHIEIDVTKLNIDKSLNVEELRSLVEFEIDNKGEELVLLRTRPGVSIEEVQTEQ